MEWRVIILLLEQNMPGTVFGNIQGFKIFSLDHPYLLLVIWDFLKQFILIYSGSRTEESSTVTFSFVGHLFIFNFDTFSLYCILFGSNFKIDQVAAGSQQWEAYITQPWLNATVNREPNITKPRSIVYNFFVTIDDFWVRRGEASILIQFNHDTTSLLWQPQKRLKMKLKILAGAHHSCGLRAR